MKQILQDLNSGETKIENVPSPIPQEGELRIRTTRTLISAGTERMLVNFGKAGMINKARQQPEKVKQVLDKVRTDGFASTYETVRNKLDEPLALGYCNVGVVESIGTGVTGFHVGDRVVSNGKHAEYVCVPKNLCATIPDQVDDDQAAFTIIASIALQGIRLIQPTLGENVVVVGLGLVGLTAIQLLLANGCRVMGIDFDPKKVDLALSFGADAVCLSEATDPVQAAKSFSREHGVDAVLITASTASNEPIHNAAQMCRKRGRIVLVGVVGMELYRNDFYEKELSFQVSCSYGPGRYDPDYEERGQDYPVGFVRWTEQRNFEAVLDTLNTGKIDFKPLISHRFKISQAPEAYDLVSGPDTLGVLLEYSNSSKRSIRTEAEETITLSTGPIASGNTVAFIGSGSYSSRFLIPAFAKTDAHLQTVCCRSGVSGVRVAKKFGISEVTTDVGNVLKSPGNSIVVIATRHDSHSDLVCEALRAGKHVFVEKPLSITSEQLEDVRQCHKNFAIPKRLQLAVGFNRRFSPLVKSLKTALATNLHPASFVMTVNAGKISDDHWTQDPLVGGGRIVGEACHFVDLLRHLADSPISSWTATSTPPGSAATTHSDNVTIQLSFKNGSMGTIHYLTVGSRTFPKERLEVFGNGGVAQINNFRSLRSFGWPTLKNGRLLRQDKGNAACPTAFINSIKLGLEPIIPFQELIEVNQVCLAIRDFLEGSPKQELSAPSSGV